MKMKFSLNLTTSIKTTKKLRKLQLCVRVSNITKKFHQQSAAWINFCTWLFLFTEVL